MKITPIREVIHKRIIGIASIWGICMGGLMYLCDIHIEKYFYQKSVYYCGDDLTLNCRVIKDEV